MDATQLQHVRDAWSQILRDALPDEQKVRVGTVGFDGDFVSATVSLRTGRVAIGFSVLVEDANSPMSVAYAFDQAVQAAGYAGIVSVRLPAGEILPPSVEADGNIPAVNDPPVDPNVQAEADAKAALAEAEYAEAPAVVDTADAEETPRRRRRT